MNRGIAIAFVALSACASGCAVGGQPIHEDSIRQFDDRGRRLPFDTVHSHRWNAANSGTEYEPCTALAPESLKTLRLDPGSVSDSAGTDGQTLRGCDWLTAGPDDRISAISQIVGNSAGIDSDKTLQNGANDVWLEDMYIRGRRVGILHSPMGGSCNTYVESGSAVIVTLAFDRATDDSDLPRSELCERAIEFTRATIPYMPE